MVGNPLTDTLMGPFLIEVMGIFPDNPYSSLNTP